MAYNPVAQGRPRTRGAPTRIAQRRGASPYEIALAWTIRRPGIGAIPKAAMVARAREHRGAAADIVVKAEVLAGIKAALPPPKRKTPLAML